jgi:hypothetical protein
MTENYLELAMDEVYSILTDTPTIPWPAAYSSTSTRIAYLANVITYFELREQYERCAKLQEIQSALMEDNFTTN